MTGVQTCALPISLPMHITKDGRAITSLLDWETYAGPKSKGHWVDDRSAKEVARAWLAGGDEMPPEVSAVIVNHSQFGAVREWQAEPEAKLRFVDFPGEPRNSDLAVLVRDDTGHYLIAVEAKADESYGKTVAQTIAAAKARLAVNSRSNGLNRLQQLQEALFGAGVSKADSLLWSPLSATYSVCRRNLRSRTQRKWQGYTASPRICYQQDARRQPLAERKRPTALHERIEAACRLRSVFGRVVWTVRGPWRQVAESHTRVLHWQSHSQPSGGWGLTPRSTGPVTAGRLP